MDRSGWWEKRWFLAMLVLASAVPLLWPETPPLVDVPAHMGRYRVQLDLGSSPELQRYFDFQWALVGNLGVDLLVQLLGPIVGLETAVKAIIVAIPPLTVVGILWISREIHGRIAPSALFAVPFVYSFPFNYGFLNYSLSLALALNAFGLWLYMTRAGRLHVRNLLFIPISFALWVAHAFGWGILGVLAMAAELIRHYDAGGRWPKASIRAVFNVAPMALPLVVMILGRGQVVGGESGQFFDVLQKAFSLVSTLRDRWLLWDSLGVAVGILLIGAAYFDRRLAWSRRLAIPAIFMGVTFLVMPGNIFGLYNADMRLAPVMFIIALASIRSHDRQTDHVLAFLGLTFVALRLAGTALSYGIADRELRGRLTALDHIPQGVPVLFLAGEPCGRNWELPRNTHIGSFVIVRKNGFSNDQWQAAGAQLLRVTYRKAGYFREDRSTFIYWEECIRFTEKQQGYCMLYDHRLETAMWLFPRDAFDYVWIVDAPGLDPAHGRWGLPTVWRGDRAVLYRINHEPK